MMTSEEIAAARTERIDQGIAVQYVKWLTNAVHGEFGLSLKYKYVMNVIKPLIGNTLVLGGVAYGDLYAGNPDRNILYSS